MKLRCLWIQSISPNQGCSVSRGVISYWCVMSVSRPPGLVPTRRPDQTREYGLKPCHANAPTGCDSGAAAHPLSWACLQAEFTRKFPLWSVWIATPTCVASVRVRDSGAGKRWKKEVFSIKIVFYCCSSKSKKYNGVKIIGLYFILNLKIGGERCKLSCFKQIAICPASIIPSGKTVFSN